MGPALTAPGPDRPLARRAVRFAVFLACAVAVAAASTAGLGLFWRWIGGGTLSLHGWIAMTLGVSGAFGLAWLLMALAFKSDREGWDARVDNSLDPGRDDDPSQS